MNATSVIFAAVVALGTISFPETADARPRHHRHYRAYPKYHHQYYHHHNYRTPRHYYYDPYYRSRGYYYHPYRHRGTRFYLQYGPLTISRGRW